MQNRHLALVLVLVGATPAFGQSTCDSAKLTCMRKYADCLVKLDEKSLKAGTPVDTIRKARCDANFLDAARGCIAMAEARQNPVKPETLCTVVGDAAALAGLVTGCATSWRSAVETAPTTTTSSLVTTTVSTATSTTTTVPGCFVDSGSTVQDTCTGLEWEKKDTVVGSGPDVGNLHDVDNRYTWAGWCDGLSSELCQPNAAAAVTCAAQTGGAYGCGECSGTCDVDPNSDGAITTVWDWLNQVNAAGFAGHSDWRLATSAGDATFPTGDVAEFESIIPGWPTPACPGGGMPCIDPIFGPTVPNFYWSASVIPAAPDDTWLVGFAVEGGVVLRDVKFGVLWVRAARPGS